MDTLQNNINTLYNSETKLGLGQYNDLLRQCVQQREMAATVFVYDHMLTQKIKPSKESFQIIETLHSKTIPESKNISLKFTLKKSLQPRRRIHKIIKGYNYSDNYQRALLHLDKAKVYLNSNPTLKTLKNRHTLAKKISKNCQISVRDARYIVTNLKRTKFLSKPIPNEQNTLLHYFSKS
tara:strand:- start:153 stop:692 length:540 start_codon:yes stop_codon:yes gene_type:complete